MGAYNQFYGCQKDLRWGANVDEYIAPYIRGVKDDGSLAIMITRLDQQGFPNNICEKFRSPGMLPGDPNPQGELCAPMTYQNKYDTLDESVANDLSAPDMACASMRKS